MTPNSVIMAALFERIEAARLPWPILWPGVGGQPPDSGGWVEIHYHPLESLDNGLGDGDGVIERGIMNISIMSRPGYGLAPLQRAAEELVRFFPKGLRLNELVRIVAHPKTTIIRPTLGPSLTSKSAEDKMGVNVQINYSR